MSTYQTYIPSAPLSAYVDFLWLHEESAQPHALERALPTGKPALWIDLGGDGLRVAAQRNPCRMTTFRTSTVLGAHSQWYIIAAGYHILRMGVQFTADGVAGFFALPASELHNKHVPLDALWGDAAANELRERLLAERTPRARFHRLERALLARMRHLSPLHPAITYGLDALLASPQAEAISQVVDQSGLSHQQFIRVFSRVVGMTPKRFGRVRRFREVIDQLCREEHINWAEIARTCGYADQAHLIRDFHEFAGVSPTEYLRDRDPRHPTYLPYAPVVPDAVHDLQTAVTRPL